MELATPDFCFGATDRQWALLLALTLRQRDEARQEAEAARWKEISSRQQATFWKTQHGRARARAEAAHNELKRLKSVSSVNELERETGRLRHDLAKLGKRLDETERENARLKARNRKLVQDKFGRKSERARRSRKGGAEREARRRRGRQPGSPSHGRTPREDLPVEVEVIEPGECRCPDCGKPYARNGEKVTEFVEVEVRAYKRRCRRPRYRSTCSCAPKQEVIAPPVPRLFANTPYGLSVWNWFLTETYALHRPLRSLPRQLSMFDFEVSPGTLGDSVKRFVPLFAPLADAIIERQAAARIAHGDETSWMVHVRGEEGDNPRSWLWVCQTSDAVRMIVDPSRSAAAAQKLFGGLGVDEPVYLVCDRYSAYKKLAKDLPDRFVLVYCWAHVRRDFMDIGVGRPDMKSFGDEWVVKIATLYGWNAERSRHWISGASEQTAAFDEAQRELESSIGTFFDDVRRQLHDLPEDAPQRKPLQSLLRHREGLNIFVDNPAVPMDNNLAERALRGPAVGRKLSFGSFSEAGAQLAGLLFSIFGTLELAGLSPRHWLRDYLQACAERGGRAPEEAHAWLPWGAGPERVRTWRAAAPQGP